ncbi:MAG: selenocysteine-specific translation elongation factor [Acidobacteriota bacterium]
MPVRRRRPGWRSRPSCTRPRSRSSACPPERADSPLRSFIVGTAGHIDHGKSALVQALTGTDPDRLKEEKERGITVDLGFAHCELGGGIVASFVDVPGHERFVRNMLAGAHGIDALLLVVAADESVMPQTREHFHICRLLDVPRGLVAMSKCDLADEETQALVELETRELVKGSFLEGRPIVPVSARTGAGLPELREALLALAREAPPRPSDGVLRLPVDRVFSMRGFGTVVTGTLVGGELAVGDEVEVLPARQRARVRGLQVHGDAVERAPAGTRTAVNLGGLERDDLGRGNVLAAPGTLHATSMVDVEITLLTSARPLEDGARVRVHLASAEALARVRLLGAERVEPGAAELAQLRLESPAVAGRGDRLIVRSYSPADTIGGALVLDPRPRRRRSADRPVLERLRAAAGLEAAAGELVDDAGREGLEAPLLASRLTVPLTRLLPVLEDIPGVVTLGKDPLVLVSREALGRLGREALEALERHHHERPLDPGIPREELRSRVFVSAPAAAFERTLRDLADAGKVRIGPDFVALSEHKVQLSAGEEEARRVLVEEAEKAGLAGVEVRAVAERSGQEAARLERVARVLAREGLLERVGAGLLLHRSHLDSLKEEVRRRWPSGSRLDVAAMKEMTGLSRKYVIPLLEYLDRERVTRRSGNDRLVMG